MKPNTKSSLFNLFVATIVMTLSCVSISRADDTDIYLGGGSLSGNSIPNIVYVIDTSGSMARDTMQDTGTNLRGNTFDPNSPDLTIYPSATYRVYNGYCTQGRYYWISQADFNNGKLPNCEGNTTSYIETTAMHCDDAAADLDNNSTVGYYKGRLSQDVSGWRTMLSGDHTSNVECKADYGVHGENGTTGNLFPAKNTGWTSIDNPGVTSLDWSASSSGDYVFFNANYLNWLQTDRMTTIMDVYIDLLTGIVRSGAKMNVSLMRYDSGADGGYFIVPHQELTAANLDSYTDAVLALRPGGYTPLTETLYEAYRFYNGLTAYYGDQSTPAKNPTSMYVSGTTDTYISPVTNQCQKNFVIMLTDGEPTRDTGADSAIRSLAGTWCSGDGACLDDLTGYMYNADCSATHSGTQNVITYAIGFGNDVAIPGSTADKLLAKAAAAGGGESFLATTSDQVINSLAKIILDVRRVISIFSAPSVSINAYNRNFHSDELYFALFQPEAGPIWPGNVKVYKMQDNTIVDANGLPVVDPVTTTIKPSALSYWTDTLTLPTGITADGADISLGGFASKLTTSRKTYTYTGSGAPNNEPLTAVANELKETNAAITTTMLGVPSLTTTERDATLKWGRGIDVNDEDGDGSTIDARMKMGDPLHSQPAVINYGPNYDDLVMYASTNEGYIHAIDIKKQGEEIFAFMPQELLPNIYPRMTNGSLANHIYGLDGPITIWNNDANNDGRLYSDATTLQSGEFVYLYQGMRRGGSHYYALDITKPTSPVLKWKISGGPSGTTGFSELGQTWSAMKKARVKIGGVERDVLVFGGGYDVTQDTADNTHTADTIGRAIYIVDAETGEKLWQAGPAGTAPERASNNPDLVLNDMTNAFPSDIVIFDTNRDGLQDRMYAADVGGQLWRFDIDNENNTDASNLVTGGMIARLYGTNVEDNRRFYHAPEVAISADRSYFAITIGSGHRAAPKNATVHDAFYVIRDPYVYTVPPTDSVTGAPNYKYVDTTNPADGVGDEIITWNGTYTVDTSTYPHLFDATDNILGSNVGDILSDGTTVTDTNLAQARKDFSESYGWFIWLSDIDPVTKTPTWVGEKVTAEATLIQSQLTFVTFTPVETSSTAVCAPNRGRGRVFRISLHNGTPINSAAVPGNPRLVVETQGMLGRVQNIIGTHSWMDCSGLKCYEGGSLSPNKTGWSTSPTTDLKP